MYTIIYGELNEPNLNVLTVDTFNEVKKMATDFLEIIPIEENEKKSYLDDILSSKEQEILRIEHQDDDHFLFEYKPDPSNKENFDDFIESYKYEI